MANSVFLHTKCVNFVTTDFNKLCTDENFTHRQPFFGQKQFVLAAGGVCPMLGINCPAEEVSKTFHVSYDLILYEDSMQHLKNNKVSYDVAVIQLIEEIPLNAQTNIACIRRSKQLPADELTIQGWGSLDYAQTIAPARLQYANGIRAMSVDELENEGITLPCEPCERIVAMSNIN
ncbi:hypothetical protein DdX_14690 [Ditylenchus destructor]|uniref:Peptidase S1 domain-containing protein n=1 Tax=Ditylenchus destructor TaxID=166010 RepID=A0AAD4MQP6_9BILA|nr:hypothetical protein DdX_14690 [Ditylenchus destructor]